MTERNGFAGLTRALLIAAALLCCAVACSAPNPNTPAGQAEIADQRCHVCILQNPGDGSPCYAICMQKEEDQETYRRTYGRP
jgi:hypothetical protein